MSTKWKWRFAALVVCAVLVAGFAVGAVYLDWRETRAAGEARRDEIVRKLDSEDPGWRGGDICAARNKALPPDERNAAVRVLVALAKLPPAYKDWSKHRYDFPLGDPEPGVLLADDDLCERTAVHAECTDALTAARSVRTLSPGGHALTFREDNPAGTLLPNTQEMRAGGALLDLDATVLAHTGRADEAIDAVHGILACGRALGDEPTLISQLLRIAVAGDAVRAAERVLSWSEPHHGLVELQSVLAEELAVPRLSHGIRGERAMLFQLVDCIDRRQVPLSELRQQVNGRPGNRVRFVLYRQHLPAQQAMIAELYTDALAADRLSGPVRWAAFDDVRAKVPTTGDDTELVRLLMPRFAQIVVREDRNRAFLGCAIAALACERYRLKFGRWPEALTAVPKEILPAVPTDPFSGGPLQYRKTENGVVLSTARPPQSSLVDLPYLPKENLWAAVEFRLFNPESRGRPAPSEPGPQDDEP